MSRKRFHLGMTISWAALIIPAVVFGWIYSVGFVSVLSIWALVSSHWSAYEAVRIEVEINEAS